MAARGYRCVLAISGSTVGIARSVEPTLTAGEQDITARQNRGFEASQPGKRRLTFQSDLLWVPTNAALSALETSFFQQGYVDFQLLDENSYGWQGQCYVTELRRGPEDQENAVLCRVSCRSNGEFFRVMAGTTTQAP